MISPKEYYILAFDTTTDAMQAEKILKEHFSIAIMPIPHEISSGCGLSIRFQNPEPERIIDFLKNTSIKGTLYKMETKKVDGKRPVTSLFSTK